MKVYNKNITYFNNLSLSFLSSFYFLFFGINFAINLNTILILLGYNSLNFNQKEKRETYEKFIFIEFGYRNVFSKQ